VTEFLLPNFISAHKRDIIVISITRFYIKYTQRLKYIQKYIYAQASIVCSFGRGNNNIVSYQINKLKD